MYCYKSQYRSQVKKKKKEKRKKEKEKRKNRAKADMDRCGKYLAFLPSDFFQDLNVWEFISGMLSCSGKEKRCHVAEGQKYLLVLPAKLFLISNFNCFVNFMLSSTRIS